MDNQFVFKPALKYITFFFMAMGIVAIVVGYISHPGRFWANLLLNNFYFLSLAIGASFFLSLQNITRSGWSSAFKRIPEAMAAYILPGAVIMLLLLPGVNYLYPWFNPEEKGFDDHALHILHHKEPYLNLPFFIIRMVVILASWIVFTLILRRLSLKEDLEGGLEHHRKSEFFSRVYIFTLALTFSVASFDWIMTLEPVWYSTIFSLKNFVSAFFHGSALIVLLVVVLHHYGYFTFTGNAHWHDFSKYIFILSIMWAYFWFSQYLLIWYANIPEEIVYFVKRTQGAWGILFYLNLILNWAVPFVVLLSNYFARKKTVLGIVVVFLLIGLWTDLFEQIMPGTVGDLKIGFTEIGMFLGFAGFYLYVTAYTLGRGILIPQHHPYLTESLRHSEH
ncbi:MAG: hypothetical protein JXA03_11255 [Bacteroidales bacterium]|nr:hypothetical protein [Bacteroidales bacterium]